MANAVAFETLDGPDLVPIDDPNDSSCFGFNWVVTFFVTQNGGLNPARANVAGHIIQRVTISKMVFHCDGRLNLEKSDFAPIYESFDLVANPGGGGSETNGDTVVIGFPKNRRTSATIVMEAAYRRNLAGVRVLQHFDNPSQNVSGASDLLAGVPRDFSPTLTRTLHVVVDCCQKPSTWALHLTAFNAFGSYGESYRFAAGDERPTIEKTVDGERVG